MWVGFQANRVRAIFDNQAVEFLNRKGLNTPWMAVEAKCDPRLTTKPNNWLLGDSANRWNYETITGYYFYPSEILPIVTILWEKETMNRKHGGYGEQPHFFPVLFNAKQFKEEMETHGVPYKMPGM